MCASRRPRGRGPRLPARAAAHGACSPPTRRPTPPVCTGPTRWSSPLRGTATEVHLSHSNLTAEEIQRQQTAADLPLLLEDTPGLHASCDAGNGVGYTYLNIRGFDQKRVGVMVNGIPLNDPEDHQVYWVDVPDLAAACEDVQVQRGITNSLGARPPSAAPSTWSPTSSSTAPPGRVALQAGSYGTARRVLAWQSGVLGHGFSPAACA